MDSKYVNVPGHGAENEKTSDLPGEESDDDAASDASESVPFRSSTAKDDDKMSSQALAPSAPSQSFSPYPAPEGSQYPPGPYIPPPADSQYPPGSYMPPPADSQYPPGSYMPPPAGSLYPPGSYSPTYGYQTSNTTTTVIVQQPSQARAPRPWSSRLCECGKDWGICCCWLFCQCYLEHRVAEDMGESTMVPCCVPGWLIVLRTKMRVQENISGSVMDDCFSVCCCGPCALCQLAYEIKVVKQARMATAQPAVPV